MVRSKEVGLPAGRGLSSAGRQRFSDPITASQVDFNESAGRHSGRPARENQKLPGRLKFLSLDLNQLQRNFREDLIQHLALFHAEASQQGLVKRLALDHQRQVLAVTRSGQREYLSTAINRMFPPFDQPATLELGRRAADFRAIGPR